MRGGESGREMGEGGLEGSEDIVGHKRCGRRMRKGKKEKRQANVAGENVKVNWNASEAPHDRISLSHHNIISVFHIHQSPKITVHNPSNPSTIQE